MALNLGSVIGYLGLDADGVDEGLDKASEKIKDGKGKLAAGAAAVGVAAGAAIAIGLAGAMDAQDANAKLTAQLDLTKAESEQAGKIAGKLYAGNYGESLDEVNEAIGAVMSSIKGMRNASSADIQALSTDALNLASAFEVEVGRSAQVAGQLITTGLAKDGSEAFDLLTAAMQRVPAAVREDLIDAADEYGPFMAQIGLSGQEAFSLLVQASQKGMYGIDKTGDAIKEFSILSTDMSTNTKAAYDAIGVSQEEMTNKILAGGPQAAAAFQQIVSGVLAIKDPAKQSQAALALFGTPLEDLGTKDIPKFLKSLQAAPDALGDVVGAADRVNTALGSTASGNIESFKRQIQQGIVTVVGGQLLPVLTSVAKYLSGVLGPAFATVTDFMSRHADVVRQVAIVLGVVAGAIGVVVAVTKAWAIAQGVMNAVMAANPVGIVVVALAGLVAGIVIAYRKVAWFRDLLNGVWTVLRTGWATAASFFSGIWHGIVEPVWAAFAATVTSLYRNVLAPAFAWIGTKWDELSGKIQLLWTSRIQPALAQLGAHLEQLWSNYGTRLVAWWNEHWPAISAVLVSMWENAIRPALSALFSILGRIVDYVQQHWPQISAVLQSMAAAVGTAFSLLAATVRAAWSVISAIWNTMKASWSVISGGLRAGASAVSTAISAIGTAAKTAWTALTTAWSGAVAWFTGLKDTVVGALSTAGTWLLDVGKNIIAGLLAGIRTAASTLASTVSGIVKDAIPGPIKKILGINSPSRVMAEQVGRWIPAGIAMGIEQHTGVVEAAMRNLVDIPAVTVPSVAGLTRGGDGASAGDLGGRGGAAAAAPAGGVRPVVEQKFIGLQEMSPRRLATFAALAYESAGIG